MEISNSYLKTDRCSVHRFARLVGLEGIDIASFLLPREKEVKDDAEKLKARCYEILAHCNRRVHVDRGRSDALWSCLPLVRCHQHRGGGNLRIARRCDGVSGISFWFFKNCSEEHEAALPFDREDLCLRLSNLEGIFDYWFHDHFGRHSPELTDPETLSGHRLHNDWRCHLSIELPLLWTSLEAGGSERLSLTN